MLFQEKGAQRFNMLDYWHSQQDLLFSFILSLYYTFILLNPNFGSFELLESTLDDLN